MKVIFSILSLIVSVSVSSQIFFFEDFDFYDYQTFKEISLKRERWTFFHSENQDFNNNRMIDNWENIKSIEIHEDLKNNYFLQFDLKRLKENILLEDVMKKGEIDGEAIDYPEFFNHVNRVEISTWDDPNITAYRPNKRYTFQFSNKIPKDFKFENSSCNDPSNSNYDIMGQWHFSYYVHEKTKPPISLRIVCDTWYLVILREENPDEKNEDFIPIAKVEKEKWTNWELKFRLSHKKRGYIELYKDGELVYSEEKKANIDSNWINNKLATFYFKIGIYKPHWWSRNTNTNKRTVFFDKVQVKRK